jgi:hypothetical protein
MKAKISIIHIQRIYVPEPSSWNFIFLTVSQFSLPCHGFVSHTAQLSLWTLTTPHRWEAIPGQVPNDRFCFPGVRISRFWVSKWVPIGPERWQVKIHWGRERITGFLGPRSLSLRFQAGKMYLKKQKSTVRKRAYVNLTILAMGSKHTQHVLQPPCHPLPKLKLCPH